MDGILGYCLSMVLPLLVAPVRLQTAGRSCLAAEDCARCYFAAALQPSLQARDPSDGYGVSRGWVAIRSPVVPRVGAAAGSRFRVAGSGRVPAAPSGRPRA